MGRTSEHPPGGPPRQYHCRRRPACGSPATGVPQTGMAGPA